MDNCCPPSCKRMKNLVECKCKILQKADFITLERWITFMKQLALTPPMGFNTWNTFSCDINEQIIKEIADAMVNEGYLAAGYDTLTIDDGWAAKTRDENGRLFGDPEKFPNGMKAVADYVHSKGLKFGIYSDAGAYTCAGYPASYGNERIDAQTFADWGVDFLKYDYCFAPQGHGKDVIQYRRMGQALRETGRDIVFSVCWGVSTSPTWAKTAGGHMWRLTGDIADSWESISKVGFGALGLEPYAGPGNWNDPDMLVIGMYGKGYVGKIGGGANTNEYRSHFALWCMLAAPLFMGHDLRETPAECKEILLNKDAIAVNQDILGVQGYSVRGWEFEQAVAKPLANGDVAVALFNDHPEYKQYRAISFEELGWDATDTVVAYDIWNHKVLGEFKGVVAMHIDPHDCAFLRLTRKK